MPTYEYRCNGCLREFEVQQKMADDDLVHCDVCGEDKLEKLISWTSVRGSGFHDALLSSNPREAMKGTGAVDRSRPPKKEKPATEAVTPAETASAASPATDAATPPATTSSTIDDEDDDDEDDEDDESPPA